MTNKMGRDCHTSRTYQDESVYQAPSTTTAQASHQVLVQAANATHLNKLTPAVKNERGNSPSAKARSSPQKKLIKQKLTQSRTSRTYLQKMQVSHVKIPG